MSGGLILGTAKVAAHPESAHRNEASSRQQRALQELIGRAMSLDDSAKLDAVNQFFNHQVLYREDMVLWGQFDYWASPLETLERGAGDCEDFALAKYFTLRLLGIPERNLRLLYTLVGSTQQAHMVLGYWGDVGDGPLILDNLHPDIQPIAQRPDLHLQFAFDTDHIYRFDHHRLIVAGDAQLLPCWMTLKDRVRREQFPSSPNIQLAAVNGSASNEATTISN
ncbi:transglutaminase-like cysteine peptidase [Pseudomonas aeruginosa]|uniref:transglutaminase-like cysteine peptidase n=1 Tax=Pseudomonas aeruginosa TaxID=287 RepID=UPI001C93C622|nr:transglutaminase-like cysteine peptidase [Pseudomonas aeruginosa]WAJ81455.1 transglutaminase-like cysteine peptidase [Pseudomonas aeruginosa]HBO1414523.1 transglutaminase-like cysteine peptidase [Pseudomonas aeruginosa]HBO3807472.1 transglutaminase-like cysteine peptidase [Pseudomonas aeruginosa]HBO7425058.1 hypothetical protein [Pseudomonas aeruginosa]HCL3530014.1 transglutaminase-like cysteine peptidase [Pseudomonas aeruginosa]